MSNLSKSQKSVNSTFIKTWGEINTIIQTYSLSNYQFSEIEFQKYIPQYIGQKEKSYKAMTFTKRFPANQDDPQVPGIKKKVTCFYQYLHGLESRLLSRCK